MTSIPLVHQLAPRLFGDLAQDPSDPVIRRLQNITIKGGGGALLFFGQPGCGKTSAARLVARSLSCIGRSDADFEPCGSCASCAEQINSRRWAMNGIAEIDCTKGTPAEVLDRVEVRVHESSCFVASRRDDPVILLDECHRNEGRLGDRLLKLVEDYRRVFFILITSELTKLSDPLRQRCRLVKFEPPAEPRCIDWLECCAVRVQLKLLPGAAREIVREARCVPRQALQFLESASELTSGPISIDHVHQAVGQFVP